MEIASLILSIIALLWGGFVFFRYERKIQEQNKRINDYQLKQFESEEADNKKALVRANIVKGEKGKRTIKVYNSGKAPAYNIRLDFTSDMTEIFYHDNIFPYEKLLPQDGTSITLQLCMGASDKISLKLIWDDDFAKDRKNDKSLIF